MVHLLYHSLNRDVQHSIIHIHNNVTWDWHYVVDYSSIRAEHEEYSTYYCQSRRQFYESLNNVMELLDPMSTSKPFEIYTAQIPELATAICGRSKTLLKFWLSVISVWIDAQGSRIISDLPGFVGPTIYNTLQRKLNNLMQMFCNIGFQFWIKFEYGQSKKPW